MLNVSDYDSTLIRYLEGKLSASQKKAFEARLSKSPEQLQLLLETKKGLALMEKIPLKEVPKNLLAQAMKNETTESEKSWGRVALKYLDRAFDVIQNSLAGAMEKEILAYRESQSDCEQLLFHRDDFDLTLLPVSDGNLNLNIRFSEEVNQSVVLSRESEKGVRIVASIKPVGNQVQFSDLPFDHYILSILDKDLILDIE